jgi:hypothetical protein
MNKPVGGRGKKAPYETVTIRVPSPLAVEFRKVTDDYVSLVVNESADPELAVSSVCQKTDTKNVSFESAIEEAKKILKSKKSAKQSIKNLLQVLYGNEIDLKTLD